MAVALWVSKGRAKGDSKMGGKGNLGTEIHLSGSSGYLQHSGPEVINNVSCMTE